MNNQVELNNQSANGTADGSPDGERVRQLFPGSRLPKPKKDDRNFTEANPERKGKRPCEEVRTYFARQRAMHYNERRKTSPLLFVNTRQD
jgi:hypothetical protein